MDRGAVYRAAEHLGEFQQAVAAVQEQAGEHFVLISADPLLDRHLGDFR